MKLLMFYADSFYAEPTTKTLESFPDVDTPTEVKDAVLAFIQVEEKDMEKVGKVTTKLLKNVKWLMNKLDTKKVVLHSFAHLSRSKANPEKAFEVFENAFKRLQKSGYEPIMTAYGYFNDLKLELPGDSLARVFKDIR